MITQARLRELLVYNKATGHFTWIKEAAKTKRTGKRAGSINKISGYVEIRVEGKLYYAHRLAWLYMTGDWPSHGVDHRDTDRSNNAWGNLREGDKSQNGCNRPMQRNNTSGYKGVSWSKREKKWSAQVEARGKRLFLGYFSTAELASQAYEKIAGNLHGEFAYRPSTSGAA